MCLSLCSLSVCVRKHRAPKGALRPEQPAQYRHRSLHPVRKHRAPKGALRQRLSRLWYGLPSTSQKAPSAKRCIKTSRTKPTRIPSKTPSQKAPSAKRCIKTGARFGRGAIGDWQVRKHRAPKGALRLLMECHFDSSRLRSESTERQKVH